MVLHEKGMKAERDRAVLVASYDQMCREFRVPHAKRLTPSQMANMSNAALYRASKDLYNGASMKDAARLAVKMGLVVRPEPRIVRVVRVVAEWARLAMFKIKGAVHA